MAHRLPFAPNTTVKIQRTGAIFNAFLAPKMQHGRFSSLPAATGASEYANLKFTHWLLFSSDEDVDDGWSGKGAAYSDAARDIAFIPDPSAEIFRVNYVELMARGEATEHKRAMIEREAVEEEPT